MRKKLLTGLATAMFLLAATGAAQATISNTNLALAGSASQSSTDYSGYARFGNDGNTSGQYGYGSGSVTHTGAEAGWWQVDLGNTYDLDTITLWNRTDCCSYRLANFKVTVLDANLLPVWSVTQLPQVGVSQSFSLPDNTTGQFVKVSLNSPNYLSLAEVQVFGHPTPEPATLLLLGSGLAGLVGARRKKKS